MTQTVCDSTGLNPPRSFAQPSSLFPGRLAHAKRVNEKMPGPLEASDWVHGALRSFKKNRLGAWLAVLAFSRCPVDKMALVLAEIAETPGDPGCLHAGYAYCR